MNREIVVTSKAPPAIGPYSQAVKFGGSLVFTAGQIPLDPISGQVVGMGIAEQAEQVLKNLSAVLSAAGSSLSRVVKVTVFLQDMNDFVAMNEVYARYFGENPPARSAVEVARLPKDVRVEIECLALTD